MDNEGALRADHDDSDPMPQANEDAAKQFSLQHGGDRQPSPTGLEERVQALEDQLENIIKKNCLNR